MRRWIYDPPLGDPLCANASHTMVRLAAGPRRESRLPACPEAGNAKGIRNCPKERRPELTRDDATGGGRRRNQ
jgi:hypothetical protein